MKHDPSRFVSLGIKNAPFLAYTALHAQIPVNHSDIISMRHQIRPTELFHESDIVTTAFAAAAERKHMLIRVIDGQMDQSMCIGHFQHCCSFLYTDMPGCALLDFLVSHIV